MKLHNLYMVSLVLLLMMGEIHCGSQLYAAENGAEKNNLERVLFVPWGPGDKQLVNPEDTMGAPKFYPERVGPSGFWLDGDGRIYIVDAYQTRIMVFKDGQYERALRAYSKYMPGDIVVWRDNIVVLDSVNLIRFNAQGLRMHEKMVSSLFESKRAERLILLGDKLLLSSDQYAGEAHSTEAVSERVKCFGNLSFEEIPCGKWENLYKDNEILDVDGDNYLYFSEAEGIMGVASLSTGASVLTRLKTDDYYVGVSYGMNNLFRLKGDFIYILRPEKKGLSVLRYKWQ